MKLCLIAVMTLCCAAQQRARDLGVPFSGTPGAVNAITDVAGVEVGHATLVRGSNVRTGVTAIWPRGKGAADAVYGAWFSLNGNGEMTGTAWIDESGFVDGPVLFTNTHSVGVVRDAVIAWQVAKAKPPATNSFNADTFWSLPVVGETWDGFLNDINGFHVKPEDVTRALDSAHGGPVEEGAVGGGTGMVCFGFKGGIGSASRRVGVYTVGAIVQCNCGRRNQLTIAGVPVGAEIANVPAAMGQPGIREERGSILIVVATDAPLLPHQLKRVARRATMGLARLGSTSQNGSGDLFLAFSTANPGAAAAKSAHTVTELPNESLNDLFTATVESVEEAIVNAMVAAKTMTGAQGHTVNALPHDRMKAALKKFGR